MVSTHLMLSFNNCKIHTLKTDGIWPSSDFIVGLPQSNIKIRHWSNIWLKKKRLYYSRLKYLECIRCESESIREALFSCLENTSVFEVH